MTKFPDLKIKGSILNLSDGRYFAALGVDWVSVCVSPESTAFIHPKNALEIKNWLFGPEFIAAFQHQQKAEIEMVMETLTPDGIELEGDYEIEWLESLSCKLFYRIQVDSQTTFESLECKMNQLKGIVGYYVLDFKQEINFFEQLKNGKTQITETHLTQLCQDDAVIFDNHFDPHAIEQIIERFQPAGINLNGSRENKPGVKSFENLDKIAEKLQLI